MNDKIGDLHVHFNSSFRDRNIYPSPFQFSMGYRAVSNSMINPSPTTLPILYGEITNSQLSPVIGSVTLTTLTFDPTYITFEYSYENSFYGKYIVFISTTVPSENGTQRKIIYSNVTDTAVTIILDQSITLTDVQPNKVFFFLRNNLNNNYLGTSTATNKISITNLPDENYSQWWISIININTFQLTGPYIRKISSSTGNVLTLYESIPVLTNTYCEMIRPDLDSFNSMVKSGSYLNEQLFMVRLLNLTIPDKIMNIYRGGSFFQRPSIYVNIGNEIYQGNNAHYINNIKTNNPFVVPVDDAKPRFGFMFYNLRNCDVELPMKLDLNQDLYFSIYTDDGILVKTYDDTLPPYPPEHTNQITATFRLRRI